jgi:REP element-mobilizing transposase RayT
MVGVGVPAHPPMVKPEIRAVMKTPILSEYSGKLPHWRMDGSTYFVTWRLDGSQAVLECEERTLVADAFKYFAGERYDLLAYVVMDDHVHVLVAPAEGFVLQKIVHNWKSFTANRLQRDFGRRGVIWQYEYFDRIVRDQHELMSKVNYILGNPARKWPELQEYAWVGCGFPLGDDSEAARV